MDQSWGFFFNAERFEEARTAYEGALRHAPKDDDLLVKYGMTLMALGSYLDAKQAFEKAIEINPGNARARQLVEEFRDLGGPDSPGSE